MSRRSERIAADDQLLDEHATDPAGLLAALAEQARRERERRDAK